MASLSLDVNPWNLTAVLVTALGAGCGPAIQLDDVGGTDGADDGVDDGVHDGVDDGVDDGVTVPPEQQCEVNSDCSPGFFCDAGTCRQEPYNDDDYCYDGGCCYDGGGCCYDGGGYGGPGGCNYYYGDCNTDADCEPTQSCYGGDPYSGYGLTGYCESLPELPECDDDQAPQLVPLPISGAGNGDVVGLAFVDANADEIPDLVVGGQDGASLYLGPIDEPTMALPLPEGTVVHDAVSADINGDGRQDLVVALGESGVAVLLADDVGGFGLGYASDDEGQTVERVIAVDFFDDGTVDIVASGSELTLRIGNGLGGFLPSVPLWGDTVSRATVTAPPNAPRSLLAAETNNVREWVMGEGADTVEDDTPFSHFAVGQWLPLSVGADATFARLVAALGEGSVALDFWGGGATTRYVSAVSSFRDGTTGDLQGDGAEDFLLFGESELTYLAQWPVGSLACERGYDLGDIAALASADTNGNGRAEVVTASGPDLMRWVAE